MSQSADHREHNNHNEVTIETLRTPPLHIQPAPIQKRFIACLIDSIIIGLAWLVVITVLRRGMEDESAVNVGYLAAVTFAYYFLQEGLFSFTIGKRLLGLRVLGKGGDAASIRGSLIRNFLRFVDWLPLLYILGAAAIVMSTGKQRLGDTAAGTIVTLASEREINPPPAPFLFH